MRKYQLAQINIALAKEEMDTETMKGFVSRLGEINETADNATGFVWRLQTDKGDSTAIRVFDESLLLVNMSVWENIETLKNFVYKSVHVELIRDRQAWFHKYIDDIKLCGGYLWVIFQLLKKLKKNWKLFKNMARHHWLFILEKLFRYLNNHF